jgi:hypothetical protein
LFLQHLRLLLLHTDLVVDGVRVPRHCLILELSQVLHLVLHGIPGLIATRVHLESQTPLYSQDEQTPSTTRGKQIHTTNH